MQATAHHPGSHAYREADGRVRLEVTAVASDACTRVGSISRGAPASVRTPEGAEAITVTLTRPAQAMCAMLVRTLTEVAVLPLPGGARIVHLYVMAPDGRLQTSERVPIR